MLISAFLSARDQVQPVHVLCLVVKILGAKAHQWHVFSDLSRIAGHGGSFEGKHV